MKLLTLSFICAAFTNSTAFAETATYNGSLNGETVTLTITTEPAALISRFIACQDMYDRPCDGPGQYAFFFQAPQTKISMKGESGVQPVYLGLYVGEGETTKGQLDGKFVFVDRTSSGNQVNGITFYQDAYLNNFTKVVVNKSRATRFEFPQTYTLRWDNHDDDAIPTRPTFQTGSIVLVRAQN